MTVNRLAISDEQERTPRSAAEWLWPLLPIGISMFCLSALVYYHLRHDVIVVSSTLQNVIAGIYGSLGFAPAFVFFLLVLTWSSIWFGTGTIERPVGRVLRLLAMTVMLGVALNLGDGGVAAAFHKGTLGAWLGSMLVAAFGYYPSLVLVWVVLFGSVLLATDFFFSESFERLRPRSSPADTGVESAVTDHLLGLAGPPEAAPVHPTGPAAVASLPRDHGASREADDSEVVVEPVVEPQDEPAAGGAWRRSYFDRRHDEERSGADEGWVPTAPDAQEIDNPESPTGIDAPAPSEQGDATEVPPAGAAEEPLVTIPRHEADAASRDAEERRAANRDDSDRDDPDREDANREEPDEVAEPIVPLVSMPPDAGRQQSLFGRGHDEELIEEAAAIVLDARRASAALLQRKLRIDYAEACRVLAELSARGIVELDADPSHGRVIGG